jgi:hypothetical protein
MGMPSSLFRGSRQVATPLFVLIVKKMNEGSDISRWVLLQDAGCTAKMIKLTIHRMDKTRMRLPEIHRENQALPCFSS